MPHGVPVRLVFSGATATGRGCREVAGTAGSAADAGAVPVRGAVPVAVVRPTPAVVVPPGAGADGDALAEVVGAPDPVPGSVLSSSA